MDMNTFVYKNIYTGCLEKGVKDGISADYASRGLKLYHQNRHKGKASKLIKDMIVAAKKMSKK